MTDQLTVDGAASSRDPIPLLPHGAVVFEAIPVRALVMEALAPAIGDGTLVVRDSNRSAVVLVQHGAISEVHAFTDGAAHSGEGTLAEVQAWDDAAVWAHRIDASLVDLCSALLRGDTIYDDLRLDWTDWPALLGDLGRRGGAFVVEIFSPAGRGVTCVAAGRQALSYTDIHPSLGDPALLEAMAQNGEGSVRVRRVNPGALADAGAALARQPATPLPAPAPAGQPAVAAPAATAAPAHSPADGDNTGNGAGHVEPQATPARDWPPTTPARDWPPTTWQPSQQPVAQPAPAAQPEQRPAPADALPDLGWIAPWQTAWREEPAHETAAPVTDTAWAAAADEPAPAVPLGQLLQAVLGDLQAIARRRLHLSASRVVAVLDEAALQQRSVDTVLAEIREMSIRGVMPSTVEEMVDEMASAARPRAV
jgi:hypothetical protein